MSSRITKYEYEEAKQLIADYENDLLKANEKKLYEENTHTAYDIIKNDFENYISNKVWVPSRAWKENRSVVHSEIKIDYGTNQIFIHGYPVTTPYLRIEYNYDDIYITYYSRTTKYYGDIDVFVDHKVIVDEKVLLDEKYK
jgi:hypothetical protein